MPGFLSPGFRWPYCCEKEFRAVSGGLAEEVCVAATYAVGVGVLGRRKVTGAVQILP